MRTTSNSVMVVVSVLVGFVLLNVIEQQWTRFHDKEMMRNFAYTREQHGRKILFNSHTLDTETVPNVHGRVDKYSISGVRRSVANFFAPSSLEGERIYLVQFKPEVALTQHLKDTFKSLVGVPLGPYLPHNAFAVVTTSDIVAKAMTMPEVSWAGDFPTEAKVYGPLLDFRSGEITQLPASASLEHGVSLDVRLAPVSPLRTLQQLHIVMAKWQAALVDVVEGTTIKVISNLANDRLWITRADKSDAKELNAIVDYLIAQDECFGVQLLLKKQSTNQYAQWITQSHDAFAQAPVSNGALPGRTIWQRGLQGQGQIIGVADSGLDYDHCFFRDTSAPTITVNNALRKVIAYQDISDDEDDDGGHGTHVCGTVLGEATASYPAVLNLHSGLAPKAKLVFSDISTTGSEFMDGLNGRDFPSLILNYAYNAGVRIHTNSWGTSDNSYDSDAASLDDFLYDHPTLTVLIAAGNDGGEEDVPTNTVGSPATAKNVITVGSGNTANAGMVDSMKFTDWIALRNTARDILSNQSLQCCESPRTDVKSFCCESYRTQQIKNNPVTYSTQTLSSFSSRGPTRDGRYKPDVIGIGSSIVSSRSDGCNRNYCPDVCAGSYNNKTVFEAKDGTSMATPGVAASVALIRQYFTEGYYPSGTANGANAFTPSGALLGAMIMNSGRSLTGNVDVYNDQQTYKSLANGVFPLSIYQGYGRIELDNVLYFTDSTFSLWVNDVISVTTGTDYDVSFVCSADGVLRVNMGYRDAAGSASAAYVTVNDADLFVGSLLNGSDTWAGNFKTMRDSHNINEAVPYNCLAGQRIYIKVRGVNIPSGSLAVALVVTGPFSVGSLTTPASGTYVVPQFAEFNPTGDTSSSDKSGMVAGVVVGLLVVGCIMAAIWYFVVYVPQNRRRAAAAKQRYDQTHGIQATQPQPVMGVPVQGQPVVMGTPVYTQGQQPPQAAGGVG